MTEGFDFYVYQINMGRKKLNEEINFYESSEYCREYVIAERITYLKSRLGISGYNQKILSSFDRNGNKYEIKKMNLDDYAKDMDIIVFNLPWDKLREIHKTMKIEEYISKLDYPKQKSSKDKINKNKLFLKDEIISGLKNKKFAKNKSTVDYDQVKMEITSISCVVYNKKRDVYEIDWDL